MNLQFDQNVFTQIGLDSGSLTMLGAVTHSFREPGEYRGSAHKAGGGQAVFYVSADRNSPAAHVNIDLASLRGYSDAPKNECRDGSMENHFTVNPKGYALFHVSGGSGGFSVNVRRVARGSKEMAFSDQELDEEEDCSAKKRVRPKEKIFNSQKLDDGDIFSAMIIRPGTYSVVNQLTEAKAEVVVSYPEPVGKTAYRPPAPVRMQITPEGFESERVELKPGQGLLFDAKTSARIVIELIEADDGPECVRQTPRRRRSKKHSA